MLERAQGIGANAVRGSFHREHELLEQRDPVLGPHREKIKRGGVADKRQEQ